MYKEIVGHTAVRKSTKLDEIISFLNSQLPNIKEPSDYINAFYFMNRVNDFDLLSRFNKQAF